MPTVCALARPVAAFLIAVMVLGPAGDSQADGGQAGPHLPVAVKAAHPAVQLVAQPPVGPAVQHRLPRPLFDPSLDLYAGPVAVPLALWIPSLEIDAPVLGVGITAENVMDAPQGPATDPVWQQAFWYRGSGIPGDSGTATLAGHVDDPLGRPAVFSRLGQLQPGESIIIHDVRGGPAVHFAVVKTAIYSARQAADPSVLAQIYGSGPVSGQGPQPAPDGLAHLTLITCTGSFVDGSYDHRLVVFATRSEPRQFQTRWTR
jgi:sortase (surface protein transpeptidase)